MTPDELLAFAAPLPEPMWVLAPDATILAANPAAARYVGRPRGELVGTSLTTFVLNPADEVTRFLRACSRSGQLLLGALEFGHAQPGAVRFVCEGARVSSGPGSAHVLLRCAAKKSPGVLFSQLNVTLGELQQAQRRLLGDKQRLERAVEERTTSLDAANRTLAQQNADLEASEAFNKMIVETAADGILTADRFGKIEAANRASEEILGYAAGELIGADLTMLIPKASRGNHAGRLKRLADTKAAWMLAARRELEAVRKDGVTIPIEIHIAKVHSGSRLSFTATFRDLSEQKRVAAEVQKLHANLLSASRRAGMADVATGILHNVGNVLNSVGVSTSVCEETVNGLRIDVLGKLATMLTDADGDLGAFLEEDPRGKRIPSHLRTLEAHFATSRDRLLSETATLRKNVEHIKAIVSAQQDYARASGVFEELRIADLVDDAVRISAGPSERARVEVVREYEVLPPSPLDRHRTLQILINLLSNARHAILATERGSGRIELTIAGLSEDTLRVCVRDDGVGIGEAQLAQIFEHGFTTKESGHGFGLHVSAIAATEMGGQLSCQSPGHDRGATFQLDLPMRRAS